MERIKFLDGFRGLAILLVICFHAFSRWRKLVPYGDAYAGFPLFSCGLLGVDLFFIISGFVILMTLEKSDNFITFAWKRWLRLFPAMLIVTAIILMTGKMFYERPLGDPRLLDAIPGLLFIDPSWLLGFLSMQVKALDGSFWSLFVEVKFYAVFGFLFYVLKREKAVFALVSLYLLYLVLSAEQLQSCDLRVVQILRTITVLFSFSDFGWFSVGALLYMFHKEKKFKFVILAGVMSAIAFLQVVMSTGKGNVLNTSVVLLVIFTIFFGAFFNAQVRAIFESRWIVYIGFISYPLYLIHQNMMISMIIQLHELIHWIPGYLLPVLPILALIAVSDIIARFMEPGIRWGIKKVVVLPEGLLGR